MRCPVPSRASYRDLLRDLLGRPVDATQGAPQRLGSSEPSYLATYRFDDGSVAAVVVLEKSLATAVAGALEALPPRQAERRVELAGGLDDGLLDALREVCNVGARLHNSPDTPHVRLAELQLVPGEVRSDVAAAVRAPGSRHDWHLTVQGYGEGVVTVLG